MHAPALSPRRKSLTATLLIIGALASSAVSPAAAANQATAPVPPSAAHAGAPQEITLSDAVPEIVVQTDTYTIVLPPPPPPPVVAAPPAPPAAPPAPRVVPQPPAAPAPNPGSAQAIAAGMVADRGWGAGEFNCLVSLWQRESGWNVGAANKSSGAYGIPQSLPGSKMASAGADWQTNPATQISWGLGYISGRYGAPCGAWDHSENKGWY